MELDVAVVLAAREGEVSRAGARLREDLRGRRRVDGVGFDCRAGSHEARDAREAITNAFDAFRLTIAEREASLKKLVDDYANGVGLDLDSRRQALIADQRDVRVARAVGFVQDDVICILYHRFGATCGLLDILGAHIRI